MGVTRSIGSRLQPLALNRSETTGTKEHDDDGGVDGANPRLERRLVSCDVLFGSLTKGKISSHGRMSSVALSMNGLMVTVDSCG